MSLTRRTGASKPVRVDCGETVVAAVVFDVGNVLYHWDPAVLYASLITGPAELSWFLAHVVSREWHFQHDAGRSYAETSAELRARFPRHRALIDAWGPRFDETITGPVAGMIELVEALSAAAVPMFAITNFSAEFWPPFRDKRANVFDRFQDIIVSGVEKIMKPDPEIYQRARARFHLGTGDALFIDDRLENVVAAEDNGFIGHHFTNYQHLIPTLEALGLPVA